MILVLLLPRKQYKSDIEHWWTELTSKLTNSFPSVSRFGIEFAGEVVKADGNVRNLAWRICNAKQVLVSF